MVCGTPLTGGNAKGKYPGYWCPAVYAHTGFVSAEKLEAEFLSLLVKMQCNDHALTLLENRTVEFLSDYERKHAEALQRINVRKRDVEARKSRLIDLLLDGNVSQDDFACKKGQLDGELACIQDELLYLEQGEAYPSKVTELKELALYRVADLWTAASPSDRLVVQNCVFQSGLLYEKTSGILNPINTNLFNVLEGITTEKIELASPTGFEPVFTAVKEIRTVVSNRNQRHGSQSLELKRTLWKSYLTLIEPSCSSLRPCSLLPAIRNGSRMSS